MIRALLLVLGAAVVLVAAACDDGTSYPLDLGDDEYNLEAMMLTDADLPPGIARTDEQGFNNEDWAAVLGADDPEAAQATLDGQQRVRNHVAFFTWESPQEHFGTVLSITSQSTIYKDETSAQKSLKENRFSACGLILSEEETGRAELFSVPRIGDDAVGMFIDQQQQQLGKSVDTIICFRTGRIVHAVVQTGLDGTQDVALSVKLARRMLARVESAFEGQQAGTGKTEATPSPTGG